METRANYILIGAFTILAAISAFIFAIWLANVQFDKQFRLYDVYFEAPVRGLAEGGTVRFNGIPVGTVARLALNPDDPKSVLVRIRIEDSTPVRVDSVAQLEPEGLTGIAYVQVSGGTPGTKLLTPLPGKPYAVIATRTGQLDRLFQGSEGVIESTLQALDRINKLLDDGNIENIRRALANIEGLTDSLNRNEALLGNANQAALSLAAAGDSIASAAKTYDALGQQVGGEVKGLAGQTTATLREVRAVAKSLREAAEATRILAARSVRTTDAVGDAFRTASDDTLPEISQAAADLRRLSTNLERVAAELERNPSSLVAGQTKPTMEWKK